jgi:hypothetical protein
MTLGDDAGAIGILTLVFCWKFVPETKGKHLEDIQEYFRNRVGPPPPDAGAREGVSRVS